MMPVFLLSGHLIHCVHLEDVHLEETSVLLLLLLLLLNDPSSSSSSSSYVVVPNKSAAKLPLECSELNAALDVAAHICLTRCRGRPRTRA
jgi:hypothetical protein